MSACGVCQQSSEASICQHISACVSCCCGVCQQSSEARRAAAAACWCSCERQHGALSYSCMRPSAYVSIRQHTVQANLLQRPGHAHHFVWFRIETLLDATENLHTSAYVSIRQHTTAYVRIRQHTSAYVKHMSACVSIRQHTWWVCARCN